MTPTTAVTDWLAPLLLVLALVLLTRELFKKPTGFPPGPARVPALGSGAVLSFISQLPHVIFSSLGKQYGSIIGMYLFNQPVVILRDYNLIREAFSRAEFLGREQTFTVRARSFFLGAGIIFGQGESWRRHRKFALRQLHSQEVGWANRAGKLVSREVEELLSLLAKQTSGGTAEIEIHNTFSISSCNAVLEALAGWRFELEDATILRFVEFTEEVMRRAAPGNILSVLPWTRHIAPGATGYADLTKNRDQTSALFRVAIDSAKKTRDSSQPPRHYVDAFLAEMDSETAQARGFTQKHLEIILMDFFQAGVETVNSTLSWACLFLATNPEVQERVQADIDALKGTAPLVWSDRHHLPYLEATINEIHRIGSVANVSVPHFTSFQAASLHGFTIPINTLILPDIYHIHHDAAYWPEPERFRPERFLGAEGELRHEPRLLAFGTGRRQCLGESLARMEVFLFLGRLLQMFRLLLPPGAPPPDPTPLAGVTYKPRPFRLQLQPRALGASI